MAKALTELDRRRRRRRRRLISLVFYVIVAVGLAWFFESQATTTIIFVRHAEKTVDASDDPSLSPAGERRAAELARQMVDADVVAGVDALYVTEFKRTRETVEPLAKALKLDINEYDSDDTEEVLETILRTYKGKIILVVGHSDTLPVLIANLGASKNVPPIAENEYDNIYLISIPWFGKTKTIRLRYGDPYVASDPGADGEPAVSQAVSS